jgi:anti-sigma factor RsiW
MAIDPELGRRNCEMYEPLLEDYLNGGLGGADVPSVLKHLHGCTSCRAALEQAAMSVLVLRAAEPSADPGPGFARIVMARIREAENERMAPRGSPWQLFVAFGWRFAATATLALVAWLSYNAGWGHRAQPNVVSLRPTIDIFAPDPARVPATGDEVLIMVADNGHEKH